MGIKKIVAELVDKIGKDEELLASFKKDPASAIKKAVKIDLDAQTLDGIVSAVKAKLLGDKTESLLGELGGLLGKK